MSDLEIMCLKSWVGHGHPVYLYSYEDISGLPVGVTLCDANEIIEGGAITYDGPMPKSAMSNAFTMLPFSDRFRFTMLRLNGGLWLDLDIILTCPIPDEMFEREFWCSSERTLQSGAYKSKELSKPTISALFVSEPEHPLFCALTEWDGTCKDAWHGQKLFQKLLTRMDLAKGVLQPSVFCDMNWTQIKSICVTMSDTEKLPVKFGMEGGAVKLPEAALGVHLFRGLLRKQGLKYGLLDVSPLSYLGRLYRQAEQAYQARLALQ